MSCRFHFCAAAAQCAVHLLNSAAAPQGAKAAADAGFEGRAELLATALCAVLLLVGLQWLSVKPRALTQVRTHKEPEHEHAVAISASASGLIVPADLPAGHTSFCKASGAVVAGRAYWQGD